MRHKRGTMRWMAALCCMALCLGGCTSASKNVYHVGICQLLDHEALNAATQGFQDALKERFGDQVVFDIKVGDGKAATCNDIVKGFVSGKTDMIMANATDALKSAAASTNTIPIVATSITDYGTALNIKQWSGMTGRNITGTSDLAPIEEQEDMILEVMPELKHIALLYSSSETNSVFQAKKIEKALKEDGVQVSIYTVDNAEQVKEVAAQAAQECEAIYMPTDNLLASYAEELKEVFLEAKIPAFAGEEGLCVAGIATLSIDYYSIGHIAGEMAGDILEGKDNPGNMSIRYAETVTKKYNAENCKELGISVPGDFVAIE